MKYLTVKETAEKWGLTQRCVQNYCVYEKIAGAKHIGKQWLIPSDAIKPIDGRKKAGKELRNQYRYHFPVLIYTPFFSSTTGLNDKELRLLEAQKLHLEGRYSESMKICLGLLTETIPSYLSMGIYVTMGFNSLMLGLHSEYKTALKMMNRIIESDTLHTEDFRLIIASLRYHLELNTSLILDINPENLSSDAVIFYKIQISLAALLSGTRVDKAHLRYFRSDLNYITDEEITPALFFYHCFLSLDNILTDEDEQDLHMKAAIEICMKNNWISHLAKFYNFSLSTVERNLEPYGKKMVSELKNKNDINVRNYKIIYAIETGNNDVNKYSRKQTELLVLVSYRIPIQKISDITGASLSELKKEIQNLCDIAGVNNKEELAIYAKKFFDVVVSNDK